MEGGFSKMSHYVKKIFQKDSFHFVIEWTDQRVSTYRLSDLQKSCPCANCREDKVLGNHEVRAKRILSVGRYALQIEFTSGCSTGIYDFDYLRKLAGLNQ
ncbi:Uncharacterized protein PHSC3_001217 [Chlamydiales bacterium STE3]|nr:Uncharacterized protein PHSC3_001217 [Chlamydiales bacterium STE3]